MTNQEYNRRMMFLQAQKAEVNSYYWITDDNSGLYKQYISQKLLLSRLVTRQRKMDLIMKSL